jgi:hypothetical protein
VPVPAPFNGRLDACQVPRREMLVPLAATGRTLGSSPPSDGLAIVVVWLMAGAMPAYIVPMLSSC